MEFQLAVYPLCMSNHDRAQELNASNYILLPSTMLLDITMDESPLLFTLTKPVGEEGVDLEHHCGVLEFVDEPGICYVPYHIFQKLTLDYGDIVSVRKFTCPTGDKIYLQPEETAFTELADPKAILEKTINQYYPVLSENDIIHIEHGGRDYRARITKTSPATSIKTLNCDIIVEFEAPHDKQQLMEEDPPLASTSNTTMAAMENVAVGGGLGAIAGGAAIAAPAPTPSFPVYDMRRFPGTGHRLGS